MAERRDSKNRKLQKGEYQKADGRYAYRYKDSDGCERWVYSWRLTQNDILPRGRQSEKCLRDLEVEIARATIEKTDSRKLRSVTLNDMFDRYLGLKNGLKEKTLLYYKGMWRRLIAPSIGKMKVIDIRYSDVAKYLLSLIDEEGLGVSSVNNVYALICPVLELAVKDDLIKKNPSNGVRKDILTSRSLKSKKKHALTISQQESFIKYLRDTPKYRRWFRLVVFLLGTGCRIGEARGLTWDDCDFERGLISIHRQLSFFKSKDEDNWTEHVTTTKTDTSERVIPMFSAVREVLLEEWKIQNEAGIKSQTIDGVSGFIFVTKNGTCLDTGNIDGAINRLIQNYNAIEEVRSEAEDREPVFLPHFSVHIFRHTFCTRMCENESNLKVVQEIMGHADITTTLNIYADATVDERVDNFKELDSKVVRI